jgi:protein-tyrosine phosphatase
VDTASWLFIENKIAYSILRQEKNMIKVLFICHGNICRSPMAEFILKDMVKKRGIAEQFEIASAATSTEEIWNGIGNPVYPPARAELAIHGISCEGKRAVQLTKADYEKYDLLIGMDSMNIKNMYRMTDGTNLKEGGKIFRLLDFTDEHRDVADPWYTGNFAKTYNDIVKGCKGLLNYCICQ